MSAAAELGGGKYDYELSEVMGSARAKVVLLVVLGGNRGDGFTMAVDETLYAGAVIAEVPSILRAIADSIEEQRRGAN